MSSKSFPSSTFGLFLHFLLKYKKSVLALLLINIAFGVVPSIDGILLQKLANLMEDASAGSTISKDILYLIIFYGLWWESLNIIGRLYDYIFRYAMPRIKMDVIEQCYSHLQSYDHDFFQNNLVGDITNRITESSKSMDLIFAVVFEKIIKKLFMIIFGMAAIYSVHPNISYIFLVWSVAYALVLGAIGSTIKKYSVNYGLQKASLAGRIVDSMSNISSVRFFSAAAHERKVIRRQIDNTLKSNLDFEWLMIKVRYILGLSCSVAIFLIVYYIFELKFLSEISIGDSVMVLSICASVADELSDLMQEVGDMFEDIGSFAQIIPVLSLKQRAEPKNAPAMIVKTPKIEFHDVTFRYMRNNNKFDNKNITIAAGEKIGVAGFSGSGKTTFVEMILALHQISAGKITIDGQDINGVSRESLYSNISVIPQDPLLFHRSILENIRYARPDASFDDIRDAAKLAAIDAEIMAMKDGYNTNCGQRGSNLSGGQRQRIIIARAFLKQAPILIMDEISSSLDSYNEHLIGNALQKLMEGKTSIVIAHRLRTLLGMDSIMVFDKGSPIATGTHDQLIESNEIYRQLWQLEAY